MPCEPSSNSTDDNETGITDREKEVRIAVMDMKKPFRTAIHKVPRWIRSGLAYHFPDHRKVALLTEGTEAGVYRAPIPFPVAIVI